MIVYLVTNTIDGKRYVGKTVRDNFDGRKRRHCTSQSYLGNAIRCHGIEAFIWEIVDSASSIESLNEKEMEWIEKLGTLHPNGYNFNTGGTGSFGWKTAEETKKAISSALKGSRLSDETKKAISLALKGHSIKPHSEEHKRAISESVKLAWARKGVVNAKI